MRLVIIDDDPFVTDSLRTILSAQPDIEVVATGLSGAEAVRLYRLYQPDILLTDIQMPDSSGLDAAQAILADWPEARVVLLTTFADDQYVLRALRLGAKGYLIKQDVSTIAPALRLVLGGQSVLGGEVLGSMERLLPGDKPGPPAGGGAALAGLTPREREVTSLVAQGLDNAEVAAALYISEGTVRNLVSAILQKLSLKNRTQLAALYYRQDGGEGNGGA